MLNRADMTDDEQARGQRIEDRLVVTGVMTKAVASQYALICLTRARAYAAHIQTMSIQRSMREWASDMGDQTGKRRILVYHNELDWLAAFLVVRYGEAVTHWPQTLTEKDLKRARDWKSGKNVPKQVTG
jgi:hypothetical protein